MLKLGVVCSAVLFSVAAIPVKAGVILGFDVNTGNPTQMFHMTAGAITADATVDLTVNIGGTVNTFSDALFSLNGSNTGFVDLGAAQLFFYSGALSFLENGTGTAIVTGQFVNADVLLWLGGGPLGYSSASAFSAASDRTYGPCEMDYAPGAALQALVESMAIFPSGTIIDLAPVEDMTFTLTNMQLDGAGAGLTFNSSYSGNAQLVPEPATLVLMFCGAAIAFGRRRRRPR